MKTIYYLHSNDSIISKDISFPKQDLIDSDFVIDFWEVDFKDRLSVWTFVVECHSLIDDETEILKLAGRFNCNDTDAFVYAERIGCDIKKTFSTCLASPSRTRHNLHKVVGGSTTYERALADLCFKLGFKSKKLGGKSFYELLQ